MADLENPPLYTELVDQKRMVTGKWYDWLTLRLLAAVNSNASLVKSITLKDQNAAIPTTAIPAGSLPAGVYRLTYYLHVTAADGVSSSVQVTLGWTDASDACTVSGAALTGDTTTTVQSGTMTFAADQAAAITYATTYASNTAGKMHYKLVIVLERIS